MKSFTDLFPQDDNLLEVTNWLPISGEAYVEDHAVKTNPAVLQAVYLTRTQMDSAEQLVRARIAFGATETGNPYIGLIVRAELATGGSPINIARCYLVTLNRGGDLRVYSMLSGSNTLIASSTVVLDNEDSHNFIVKVRDHARGAEILVFIGDEVSPVLTVVDYKNQCPKGMYVGFDINDGTLYDQVSIADFYAHILRSAVIRNPQPVPELKNFGDLIYEACFRIDRAGNSQFNQTQMGNFINYSLAEIYNRLGWCKWWLSSMYFNIKQGIRDYEFPAYVGLVYDIVDLSNGRSLTEEKLQDYNRMDPKREYSGIPGSYVPSRTGDLSSTIVTLTTTPSSDISARLDFYWKPIPMVDLTDIPFFPPNFNEILIFGALKRGSQYDTSKNFYMTNQKSYEDMLRDLMEYRRQTLKGTHRIITENDLVRSRRVGSVGPVTRAEQLGL